MTGPLAGHRGVDAYRAPVAAGRTGLAATGETPGCPRALGVTDDGAATPTDVELMARVAGGDHEAFATLYDRHAGAIYGAVLRYLGDQGAAEDIVQEVYLAMWQRPAGYAAEKGSLIGWLLAVARNRAIDRLRAASRRPLLVGLDSGDSEGSESDFERLMALGRPVGFAATADEPPDVAERRWLRAVVRTALDAMSDPERQVLELAYDDGLTQTEIAGRLGWPAGTVKTRTRRALLRLRAMLESVPDIGPWARRSTVSTSPVAASPVAARYGPDGVRNGPR